MLTRNQSRHKTNQLTIQTLQDLIDKEMHQINFEAGDMPAKKVTYERQTAYKKITEQSLQSVQ